MLHEAIRRLLDEKGVPYKLHPHEPLLTVKEIEGRLPFPPDRWVKSLAFQVRGEGWALVALHAYSRLDYRKLADALGVKRGQLVQPPPEALLHELGFEAGGVAPIPTRPGVKTVYDSALAKMHTVYCGSGRSDLTLEANMQDLIKLVKPILAPVAEEWTED
jgi:Cys-tRNA(Pro)/Cys-tRNA(Cys) deacylase